MRIAILCPGQSLSIVPANARPLACNLIIGVNRAVMYRICDWWTFTDSPMYLNEHVYPKGTPRVFTTASAIAAIKSIETNPTLHHYQPMPFDVAIPACPLDTGWSVYSATAALVLAAHLGASSIDVFGADWTPEEPDWDGVNIAGNRSAHRFESERVIWNNVTTYLHAQGINVKRIMANVTKRPAKK